MTNEELIKTVKHAMRNDTVFNKGVVELLCSALENTEAQVKPLAAENVALKAAISAVNRTSEECELNGDEIKYVVGTSEFEALTDLLDDTSATDAILASLRAEGLDEMAATYRAWAKEDDCSCNMKSSYNLSAERAESYAAYIRHSEQEKGVQS